MTNGENPEAKIKVVYLFGVGFDEKLVIRAALKVGVKPEEIVVLAYGAAATGELEKEKVTAAVNNLKKIFESAGIQVIEVPIEARNFAEDVKAIVDQLRQLKPNRIVVSLGSGMRYLAFVLLFSSLVYRDLISKGTKVVAHVAREDGLYDVTMELDEMRVEVGPRVMEALCLFYKQRYRRDEAVKKATATMGIKYSTFYRLLDRMEKAGLIVIRDSVIELTELASAIAAVKCTEKGK